MYRIISVVPGASKIKISLRDESGDETELSVAKELLPGSVAEGASLGEEEFEELSFAAEATKALSKALDALAASPLSAKALTDKLRFKYKFSCEASDAAAEVALSRGYIDEASQSERIAARSAAVKLWGRRRIVDELCSKGYPLQLAKEAASAVPKSVYDKSLARLVDKKCSGGIKDPAKLKSIASSLVRLGHSPSDVKDAIAKKIREND